MKESLTDWYEEAKVIVPYEAGAEIAEDWETEDGEGYVTMGTTMRFRDMWATWAQEVACLTETYDVEDPEIELIRALIADDLIRIVMPKDKHDEIENLYNKKEDA